jgi:hypothetical protein
MNEKLLRDRLSMRLRRSTRSSLAFRQQVTCLFQLTTVNEPLVELSAGFCHHGHGRDRKYWDGSPILMSRRLHQNDVPLVGISTPKRLLLAVPFAWTRGCQSRATVQRMSKWIHAIIPNMLFLSLRLRHQQNSSTTGIRAKPDIPPPPKGADISSSVTLQPQ